MKKKPDTNRYDHSQITKSLNLLRDNNFNYLLTSKQTSVSRPTLKKWEKKYGQEVFTKPSPSEQAIAEMDAEMKNYDINIIRYLYILRKRSLHKLSLLLEKENRIEPLLAILKHVSSDIDKFSEIEKAEKATSTENFIAIITKQLMERDQQESGQKSER